MKWLSHIRRYKLYVWLVPAFILLNLLTDAIESTLNFPAKAVNEIWLAVYLSVVNYFLFEYSIPGMSWKKVFRSVLLVVLYFFVYSLGFFIWRQIGIGIHVYTVLDNTISVQNRIGGLLGYGIGSVIVFGIARHIYNYINLKQISQQLRIESQQAELNYLKSQTNPHFLFNTLNNIYALARDKSDLAPESILRLSKILRYMLYETSAPNTSIEQELRIIEDYIALEKLRYDDSLNVNISHDLEDAKQGIPPLLFIPLVENAFKHGVSETREHPFLNIHISLKNRRLIFTVQNSTGEPATDINIKENIGLSNLRRQLALLYTDYHLLIEPANYKFTATLNINLNSHV
ncbi:histidine kinase [Chitinophaga silvatica]|uniref:Histidine kinase n=1 Tax=Chitinophaga silvatica TaxID=2282649 RepID=A0A3E1YEJ2_9BACT|nr:histidine kinase [Chitinophaga silvatica]RFS24707.1 histidine kinase [Chitinophaga silvatica]